MANEAEDSAVREPALEKEYISHVEASMSDTSDPEKVCIRPRHQDTVVSQTSTDN